MYLHSNSTQILAYKKKHEKKIPIIKKKCLYFMQLFSADNIVFFDPEKVKKQASKVAHNPPNPLFFTVQSRPQPTAQNWFFILWNLGTRHLFSYLWFLPCWSRQKLSLQCTPLKNWFRHMKQTASQEILYFVLKLGPSQVRLKIFTWSQLKALNKPYLFQLSLLYGHKISKS